MGRLGVDFLREAAAAPSGTGSLAAVATTSGATIRAGTFVFACGPWLPKVFPDLLVKRIAPTRQEAFFFGTPPGDPRFSPPAMPVWIDFSDPRGPYGFPDLENRGVKIALDQHGPSIDPDTEGGRLFALIQGMSFQSIVDPERWSPTHLRQIVDLELLRLRRIDNSPDH